MPNIYKIYHGDAASTLANMPAKSVHCCITSPPYFGLRDYGVDGQIGLEESPREYIDALVDVFAEVYRVLRDDGTLWVVIGDKYAASGGDHAKYSNNQRGVVAKRVHAVGGADAGVRRAPHGMKAKDLIGIPWMLAFALRDWGWYLRQEVIWAKSISGPVYRGGSCMPESVRDRCTRSHETVFMLSKSPQYFFDSEAIKEPAIMRPQRRHKRHKAYQPPGRTTHSFRAEQRDTPQTDGPNGMRNWRTVWHVNPKPFKGAHFATFPPALIEPMILAGTSEFGVCDECLAPRVRKVERTAMVVRPGPGRDPLKAAAGTASSSRTAITGTMLTPATSRTTGWEPTCDCAATRRAATVLDPFCGAGTTGLVALAHGRSFIGIELNEEYISLTKKRIQEGL